MKLNFIIFSIIYLYEFQAREHLQSVIVTIAREYYQYLLARSIHTRNLFDTSFILVYTGIKVSPNQAFHPFSTNLQSSILNLK